MYITQIEVSEYPSRHGELRRRAHVRLQSDRKQVQMECAIREDEARAGSRLAFIRDALRQVRRMPEFRRGTEEITFAPELGDQQLFLA